MEELRELWPTYQGQYMAVLLFPMCLKSIILTIDHSSSSNNNISTSSSTILITTPKSNKSPTMNSMECMV